MVELNYTGPGWCHDSKEWFFPDEARPSDAAVGDKVELTLSSIRPELDGKGRIILPPEEAAKAEIINVKAEVCSRMEFKGLDGALRGYKLMLRGEYEGNKCTIELRATIPPSVLNGVKFLL